MPSCNYSRSKEATRKFPTKRVNSVFWIFLSVELGLTLRRFNWERPRGYLGVAHGNIGRGIVVIFDRGLMVTLGVASG